jgi:peptide chain release factor subunit 3
LAQLDKKTGKVAKKKPMFVKNGDMCRAIIECAQPVCAELFADVQQLGRFTLRDEGKTIAIGKVISFGPKKAQN